MDRSTDADILHIVEVTAIFNHNMRLASATGLFPSAGYHALARAAHKEGCDMALDQKDKELVAIGASIGALCRPCIEHHIPTGRDAGLTEAELAGAVEAAHATHRIAADLLFRRSRELLDGKAPADVAVAAQHTSRPGELVALGASVGANCHPLLEQHVAGALRQGLTAGQVRSAIKMAEFVQQHAAEVTAAKAAAALEAAGLNPAAAS